MTFCNGSFVFFRRNVVENDRTKASGKRENGGRICQKVCSKNGEEANRIIAQT